MKRAPCVVLVCIFFLMRTDAAPGLDSDKALPVITQYVRTQKGWKPSVYRIESKGREGPHLHYWVIYIPEEKEIRLGGGKSFGIIYDPIRHRVIEELAFQ